MTARVDFTDQAATRDAAIRKHYDDPDGRGILAQRGIQLPGDEDSATGTEIGS